MKMVETAKLIKKKLGHRKHETEVHELANFKQKICKIKKKYIWFSDEILYFFNFR